MFEKAFILDDPKATLAWRLSEQGVRKVLDSAGVRQITAGHLVADCRLLGGIEAEVSFHFTPRHHGGLTHVELYRSPTRHRKRGFNEWQQRLEQALGPPHPCRATASADQGLQYAGPFHWKFGRVIVLHEWYYHTGEHERISFTFRNSFPSGQRTIAG